MMLRAAAQAQEGEAWVNVWVELLQTTLGHSVQAQP